MYINGSSEVRKRPFRFFFGMRTASSELILLLILVAWVLSRPEIYAYEFDDGIFHNPVLKCIDSDEGYPIDSISDLAYRSVVFIYTYVFGGYSDRDCYSSARLKVEPGYPLSLGLASFVVVAAVLYAVRDRGYPAKARVMAGLTGPVAAYVLWHLVTGSVPWGLVRAYQSATSTYYVVRTDVGCEELPDRWPRQDPCRNEWPKRGSFPCPCSPHGGAVGILRQELGLATPTPEPRPDPDGSYGVGHYL